MKKVIGMFGAVVLFAVINVNATDSSKSNLEEMLRESCVSIASGIANGDSEIFRAAYVGCINGRL